MTGSVSRRDGGAGAAPAAPIRVADTGIGFPAPPPHGLHDPAAEDIAGAGLGLAIAKSIVDARGRIVVGSTEGVGSVLTVERPESARTAG